MVGLLVDQLSDQLRLVVTQLSDEHLQALHVEMPAVRQVIVEHLKALLVHPHQHIDATVPDRQAGHMWQEVVAHEKTQEDEVVNHPLQLEFVHCRKSAMLVSHLNELTHSLYLDELEVDPDRLRVHLLVHLLLLLDRTGSHALREEVTLLPACRAPFVVSSDHYLPDDVETRLMGR